MEESNEKIKRGCSEVEKKLAEIKKELKEFKSRYFEELPENEQSDDEYDSLSGSEGEQVDIFSESTGNDSASETNSPNNIVNGGWAVFGFLTGVGLPSCYYACKHQQGAISFAKDEKKMFFRRRKEILYNRTKWVCGSSFVFELGMVGVAAGWDKRSEDKSNMPLYAGAGLAVGAGLQFVGIKVYEHMNDRGGFGFTL